MKVIAGITACLAIAAGAMHADFDRGETALDPPDPIAASLAMDAPQAMGEWGLPASRAAGTPDAIRARLYQSYTLESRYDYAGALKVLQDLPADYLIELRRGWLSYLLGSYGLSVQHYRAAMTLAPGALEPQVACLLPLMALKEYSVAESLARQVLQRDPDNYLANLRLACVLRLQRRWVESIAIDHQMLALYPSDTSFLTELGLSEAASGQKTSALAHFREALALDSTNSTASAEVGRL